MSRSRKPRPKPPKITDFSKALLEVVHNEGVSRHRIDTLEAMLKSLMAHLGLQPVFEEPQPSEQAPQKPFTEADGVPAPNIVIPEGAARDGHWHASCVHGYEWGNNCRCIPEKIEYTNVPCPEFCEGVSRQITRKRADVH